MHPLAIHAVRATAIAARRPAEAIFAGDRVSIFPKRQDKWRKQKGKSHSLDQEIQRSFEASVLSTRCNGLHRPKSRGFQTPLLGLAMAETQISKSMAEQR